MTNHQNRYDVFADLLEYPAEHWAVPIGIAGETDSLANFRCGIEALSVSDLQELYTRTFDLNPVCTLEIGYHLFGENYKRGEFLANLRETEAAFALGQENQLPDYLPVLLRLLTKLPDEELRISLISDCLIPAIEKMLRPLRESENPYRFLLEAVRATLQTEVPHVSAEAPRFRVRTELPVLNDDLVSGSAAGCAVVAPPHRRPITQFDWGCAPNHGVAPNSLSIVPEGQRPSAHQAAEPQSEFAQR